MTDEQNVQTCVRCTIDSHVPGTRFDEGGECSYCRLHDALEEEFPLDERGQAEFEKIVKRIKSDGRNKPFDCVAGLSGGRDSTYTLLLLKQLGLRPLAVHFNDGFGNPVAGQNMQKTTKKLGIELRTITSDWRESKDLRIACLKASVPDLNLGCDIGIATSLFGAAAKENVGYTVIGQSFRTEGIAPLEWNYLDGRYLNAIQNQFGTVSLRDWSPENPGYHLELRHVFYYTVIRRIKTFMPLYYQNYVRNDVDTILEAELGWKNPGAHYYDDLYQSLMFYLHRVKWGFDRRQYNYAALVRSGQMTKERAHERMQGIYEIEDPKVIDLCIKRLGLSREEFDEIVAAPPKYFHDYPNNLKLIRRAKPLIKVLSLLHVVPKSSYLKYCGEIGRAHD